MRSTTTNQKAVDPEFVAEIDRRFAVVMTLARQGVVRGSIVLHILDDGSLWGYSFGDVPADLRALASKLNHLDA